MMIGVVWSSILTLWWRFFYAKTRANDNVDHRVLRVTDQALAVATMNDL